MKRGKNKETKYSSNLPKIQESESETSESEINNSSSDNKDKPMRSGEKLINKSQQLRQGRLNNGGSSAEDIPKNAAPPPKNKKRDLQLRVVSSTILIAFLCFCFAAGHIYQGLFLIYVGFTCYWELLAIKRIERKSKKIQYQYILDWYYPLTFVFFLLPHTLLRRIIIDNDSTVNFKQEMPIVYNIFYRDHILICAMLLIFGLVLFTLSLEQGHYKYQFKLLGWQIICTMVSMSSGFFFSYYVFKGYFWVLVINGSVMMNDIFAYVFGKSFGKTKLIALSPNKTVEGFVGGGITTLVFALWISGVLSDYQQLVCPQDEITFAPFQQFKCTVPQIYEKQQYILPFSVFGFNTIWISAVQIHSTIIALFAALIAPFGGFFASGLKRSLKLKDFADSIPGHGGFADRFDCHIVCSFFAYVYLTQIVYKSGYSTERVFDYIQKMEEEDKIKIFNSLKESLNM